MIRSFNVISFLDFKSDWFTQIKQEIESKGKDYILSIDEDEFAEYLHSKYELIPLNIDHNSETINQPSISKEWFEDRMMREKYQRDVYSFIVKYNFSGSPVLFKVQSNPWSMTSYEININKSQQTVSFGFKLYTQDVEDFKKAKKDCYESAFFNMGKLNQNIAEINNGLLNTIKSYITTEKNKYQKENDFFTAINVKVNKDTESVFTTPTIKKKIIPQPKVPKDKEFASEPTMSKIMYDDILKVVYDSGKNMEKKPALYKNKDEEGLRDQFLFVLETRYDGITASGETFNRSGKTDILLKYAADGTNLFVAECKFWHGASDYLKAISQLFDKYLTWRDSKVALMMFVTNNDFSKVLQTVEAETLNHPYSIKRIGERGESSFTYEFHLPQDKEKSVLVEIMAFHYDKK